MSDGLLRDSEAISLRGEDVSEAVLLIRELT